ncbi:MAG: hypothetical protein FWB95_04630 [Treponema sp.]|nr:hypothetical protein [Treponema sp.]
METIYKLNAQDLTSSFVASVQSAYLDRDIEITVREADSSMDETEYLMLSPANRTHITNAIENIENGKNIIYFKNLEQAIEKAEKAS